MLGRDSSNRGIEAEAAYLFRHAVLRDAAYQLQMPADRARLHALVVEIIETTLADKDLNAAAVELAEHAKNAGERFGAKEVTWRMRAVEHALDLLDYAQVARQSELVAAHAAATPNQRSRARMRLGDSLRQRGFSREALSVYDQVLSETPEMPKSLRGSAIRARADARYRLGQVKEAEADYKEAILLIEESAEPDAAATAYGNYGLLLSASGRQELAEEYFRKAIARHEAMSSFVEAAAQEVNLANVLMDRGDTQQALELMQRARQRGAVNDPAVYGTESLALNALGRKEEAYQVMLRALELSRQNGQRLNEGVSLSNLGSQLSGMGRFTEAVSNLENAVNVLAEIGAQRSCACARGSLATANIELGRIDVALENWATAIAGLRAIGATPYVGRELSVMASDQLKIGDVDQARRCLDEARPLLSFPTYSGWLERYFYPPLLRLRAHENDAAGLETLRNEILNRYKQPEAATALASALDFANATPQEKMRHLVGYHLDELGPSLRRALPDWWHEHNPKLLAQLKAARPDVLQALLG